MGQKTGRHRAAADLCTALIKPSHLSTLKPRDDCLNSESNCYKKKKQNKTGKNFLSPIVPQNCTKLEANPLTKYLTAAHSSRCWVFPRCLCAHCATMVCSQCTADCGKRLKRECLHSTSTERANWSGLCGGEWQEEGNYAETVAVALSC